MPEYTEGLHSDAILSVALIDVPCMFVHGLIKLAALCLYQPDACRIELR